MCVWVSYFAHFDLNVFSDVTDISSSLQTSFIYLCMNISHPSSKVLHALTKADDDFSSSLGFLEVCPFFFFYLLHLNVGRVCARAVLSLHYMNRWRAELSFIL